MHPRKRDPHHANQPRKLGPELLVKTSRSGRPFEDHDQFGMDFNVEYSLNKNNRWELPEIIASELPRYKRATLSTVNVELALSKKERQKIQESKNYDERYHLKGATAQTFQESIDGEIKKKASKTGRTQLRTWNNPKKHSRPHDYEEEGRVICICGKCKPTQKENIVDYTVVTYTSTCRDGDRRNYRQGMHTVDETEEPQYYWQKPEPKYSKMVVDYLPKKKKNEMRRLKHEKHTYAEE
ncbi:unnamed protein product, partial [Mesorhabditis spiculigera]